MDTEYFPLLSDDGRRLLVWLREHPHAPRYTARSGHRLTAEYLHRVRDYEAELQTAPKGWPEGGAPAWLNDFVAMCFREAPFYRRYGQRPARFADIPTFTRAELARAPWAFVPDSAPLDDLIINATSGTTGHALTLPSHPVVGACYTPLLKAALALKGIELTSGRGQVACILVGYQRKAFTYASVTPQQDEAGHLKLNLHPDDWRDPADRARFLDACNPEIYTGDPVAFAELMRLSLTTHPRAIISTAMMLLPGLRAQLESHFNCPVLDVYSMNETGPLAVTHEDAHHLLQPHVFVEILDEDGNSCPPGVRGEVTLTGGLNFYLPLLRYRTNDYAALEWREGLPVLIGLEGRPPVLFRGAQGQIINTLDVTAVLRLFAFSQFTVHQSEDGTLTLTVRRPAARLDAAHAALLALFGSEQKVVIAEVDSFGDKVVQYTSALREDAS